MSSSKYLIVGGGMAADAAVRGIRDVDSEGSITLIGAEPVPPYARPPLSKKLWTGKSFNRIWLKTDELGVDLHLGRTVLALDPVGKRVVDDHGVSHGYGKLLLATGVEPRVLWPADQDGIIYFRTVADYRRLRQIADDMGHVVVIGGGFIGSEVAAALAMNGVRVTMIFPGAGIGDRLFPDDLSLALNDLYRERGVDILAGFQVTGLERHDDGQIVQVRRNDDGLETSILADGVVAGVGTRPVLELPKSGGIATGDGIIVDEFLRTDFPDIYAAGDVANAWVPRLEERRRVEHEDNAQVMGRHAGRAMAGQAEPYDHLPFFYSDMFDQGYEAVGELNASLETVSHWVEPYRKGIVYYLGAGRVRGVLLWNVWGQVEAARSLIGQHLPHDLDLTRESILIAD